MDEIDERAEELLEVVRPYVLALLRVILAEMRMYPNGDGLTRPSTAATEHERLTGHVLRFGCCTRGDRSDLKPSLLHEVIYGHSERVADADDAA